MKSLPKSSLITHVTQTWYSSQFFLSYGFLTVFLNKLKYIWPSCDLNMNGKVTKIDSAHAPRLVRIYAKFEQNPPIRSLESVVTQKSGHALAVTMKLTPRSRKLNNLYIIYWPCNVPILNKIDSLVFKTTLVLHVYWDRRTDRQMDRHKDENNM